MSSKRRPWEAERSVSPELARVLVGAAAPELANAAIEAFASGWDNTAYLVDQRWVFRFPRREIAVASMETEIRALPLLARRSSLRVPRPVHIGRPSSRYPWPYAGYELLPGDIVALRELPPARDASNAERLGAFLAQLHAATPEVFEGQRIPGDLLRRLDPTQRIPLAHGKLDELEQAGVLRDAARFRGVLDASLPASGTPRPTALVHGDFDARHLLADRAGAVTGVIDWGDLHFGDPALDLAIVHTFVPPEARRAFRDAYGPISEQTWSSARFRALHNTLHVLDWAVDTRAARLEASARGWLERLMSD